jgi:glyoxylase-like metal-dependent hydrolase (beta-lactamase superfamily II)
LEGVITTDNASKVHMYCLNSGNHVYSKIESTTSLILTGEHKIIVDPSTKYSREKIMKGLKSLGLQPNDIDTVVLTHYHLDHVANYGMFKNAQFFIHDNELKTLGSLTGTMTLAVLKAVMREFGFSIGDFVGCLKPTSELMSDSSLNVLETFGHTGGSISLCVSGQKRIVLSGDALTRMSLAEEFFGQSQNGKDATDLYSRSLAKIIESGEIIVPGHDRPFMKSADGYIRLDAGVDLASV